MLRGLVIVVCGVGCIPEPTFKGGPRDADPEGIPIDAANPVCPAPAPNQVSVQSIAGATRVCGPNYHFEFSNIGARFPYQMDIAGTALMADGLNCNDERGLGIGLYPTLKINGEGDSNGTGTIRTELGSETDAIVKVAIDWTATFTCSGSGTLGTRSTFTFFPDGRVHRFDHFDKPDPSVSTGNCNVCQVGTQNDSFYLTSYTTVAVDVGGMQLFGATGGDHTALDMQGESLPGGADVCHTTRQRHIAFAWRNLNNTQASSGTRVRVARLPQAGQSGAYAFVYDQLNGQGSISSATANALLHTTMLLGDQSTSCATLLGRTIEYTMTAPPLVYTRGGDSGPIGFGLDGIYGGEQVGVVDRGQDIPGAAGEPITLSNTAGGQRAFAVWLELATHHPTFVLSRSFGMPGNDWYRFQRATGINGQTQVIFWFPDGLPAGQTITIDPS